ncbi:MAG: crotonobetainyl-CoA--carnitine CoA-transferase [Candidatus Binatia bacterium]
MNKTDFGFLGFGPPEEAERRTAMIGLLRDCPVPDRELLLNLGLFLTPQTLSRVLFLDFLYRQVLDVQGVVMELGCRWGQSLALFSALRGIYEPFNRLRKIVGFDTFAGFPAVTAADGTSAMMSPGAYAVTEGYAGYLDRVLQLHEQESPLAHLKKYALCAGDVTQTLPRYLADNPETVVALAYFDLDLYEPTRACLEALKDRITRGTVLGFDELNDHHCPGETLAVKEVLGLGRYALRRFPHSARTSYLVVE